jgi:hypothetical protein
MAASFRILHTSQRRLFAVREPYGINIDVQLSTTPHPPLGLGLYNRPPNGAPFWDHGEVSNLDLFENIEIHPLILLGGG